MAPSKWCRSLPGSCDGVCDHVRVRDDAVQCRAWVRRVLNQNCLHFSLEALLLKASPKVLAQHYELGALIRDPSGVRALCEVLRPMDSIACDLEVDDAALDELLPVDPFAVLRSRTVAQEESVRAASLRDVPCCPRRRVSRCIAPTASTLVVVYAAGTVC